MRMKKAEVDWVFAFFLSIVCLSLGSCEAISVWQRAKTERLKIQLEYKCEESK